MKYFLITIALAATCCSAQERQRPLTGSDTLRLPEPRPEPRSKEDSLMFKNCLILFRPGYSVIHKEQTLSFGTRETLANYLKKKAKSIRRGTFYLISDSNTSYTKILPAIELMQDAGINNYKIINYQEYFAPPGPVVVETPTSTAATAQENDSSGFRITILGDSIKVSFLNAVSRLNTAHELDDFITSHQEHIDAGKIFIIGSDSLKYDKFKSVIEVLKKHEYYRYHLVVQ